MQSNARRPLLVALVLLLAFWLAIANWRHPVLRLGDDYANLIALWLLLLLPWGAVVTAVRGLRRWWRWATILLALPALCFGTLYFALVSIEVANRHVGSPSEDVRPIWRSELPRGGELVVYLEDCSPLCGGFGVVARQERQILPGVRVVRNVYSRGEVMTADVHLVGTDSAYIDDEPVRLRRWVWF